MKSMKQCLDGNIYSYSLDGWNVSWESDHEYRYWCLQTLTNSQGEILVVMMNPGSLSGDGKNIKRDTTLRILRDVFEGSQISPFVINLFDYATASPKKLFENWQKRDGVQLIYSKIKNRKFLGVLYAYGDYKNNNDYGQKIRRRIKEIKTYFAYLPEVVVPRNRSGSPKHPLAWQRQKIKSEIKHIIRKFIQQASNKSKT